MHQCSCNACCPRAWRPQHALTRPSSALTTMSGGDPLWATALASAASGAFARLCCHPLDTCKSRLQVQTERASTNRTMYKHTLDALRQTLRHEGVRGLYRGFAVTAIGAIPATCLYLTSYDVFKQRLSGMSALEGSPGGVAFTIPFCAGMLAETLSCVLWEGCV